MRIAVLIPTRNRSDLAAAAVASVFRDLPDEVHVVVSDNSTEESHRAALRESCSAFEGERLRLVVPPQPLAMTPHWAWAVDEALTRTGATHLTILTDRMVFKPSALRRLVEIVGRHDSDVISYNHDIVDDYRTPVELTLVETSGLLVPIRSAELIRLGSLGTAHASLPRMLNCVTPVATIEQIRERFGSVIASNAPDHCFAYRCLAIREEILYRDDALLVHYATDRSYGANYTRGTWSAEREDFVRLGVSHEHSPIPELHAEMNPVVNEYCFVRQEVGPSFPQVDMPSYLDSMERGVLAIEDVELRREMLVLLREADRRYLQRRQPFRSLRRARRLARSVVRNPSRSAHRALERVAPPPLARRLGLAPGGPRVLTFPTTADAIAFANEQVRPRNPRATHLVHIVDRRGLQRAAAMRDGV